METLQEWLKSSILSKINDGLQWLEKQPLNSPPNDLGFLDDGKALYVKVSKPGVVQITKLMTYEEPIQAWVSDSITRLLVVFSASAVHKYLQETGKRLTQDSLGGLILIKDSEIVATHSGPRPHRLIIKIEDFQSLGSVGSGVFGLPRPLEALPEAVELLDRLTMIRSKDSPTRTQNELTWSSPAISRHSRSDSEDLFVTQMPRSRLAKSLDAKALKSNGASHRREPADMKSSPAKPFDIDVNAIAPKSASQLRQLDSRSKRPHGRVNHNPAELLKLLEKNQTLKMSTRSKSDKALAMPDNEGATTRKERLSMEEQSEVAKNLSVKNDMLSEAQGLTTNAKPEVTPRIETDREVDAKMKTLNPDAHLERVPSPQFRRTSRISRREVEIVKSQQKLLDRINSWIPAEPGQRKPVGNIPIAILNKISDQVEGRSQRLNQEKESPVRTPRKAERTASGSVLTSDGESSQESGSEILILPKEWPSTPAQKVQEQLPPDSSAVLPAQASEIGEELVEDSPPRKRQKLSLSPVSTGSEISSPGNPISIPRSTRSIELSPISQMTPTRQNYGMSRPSEMVTPTMVGKRSPSKHQHERSNMSSATKNTHTPMSILSTKSTPTVKKCAGCHVAYYSPRILSRHEKYCLKGSRQVDVRFISSNSDFSRAVKKPDDQPVPQEPVLQVKATPYINGHLLESASTDINSLSSPTRRRKRSLSDTAQADEPKETVQSPPVIEISSDQISSSKPIENIISVFDSSEAFKASPIADLVSSGVHAEHADCQGLSHISCSARGADDLTQIDDTFVSVTAPTNTSNGEHIVENLPTRIQESGQTPQTPKRKFSEMQPLSTDSATRQKHVESPILDFAQDDQILADPSILNRNDGQDSRNSCQSSKSFLVKEVTQYSPVIKQAMTSGSKTKSFLNEGALQSDGTPSVPVNLALTQSIPRLDSENRDISEAITPHGMEKLLEQVTPKNKDQLANAGRSLNKKINKTEARNTVKQATTKNFPLETRADISTGFGIFDQFRTRYPKYTASFKQFLAICGKIKQLVKEKRMEHQYLWDDFIIRHKIDYPVYLSLCAENADDPLSYEHFYRQKIAKPLFTYGIVKPENLDQVFLPLTQVDAIDQPHPHEDSCTEIGSVVKRKALGNPIFPMKASGGSLKLFSPQGTIDLTSDDEVTANKQGEKRVDLSAKKRPLPWQTPSKSRASINKVYHRTSSSGHISNPSPKFTQVSSLRSSKPSDLVTSAPEKPNLVQDKEAASLSQQDISVVSTKSGKISTVETPNSNADRMNENHPFANFAKAYIAIQNGNGNSYARDRELGSSKPKKRPARVSDRLKLQQIDVLSWQL